MNNCFIILAAGESKRFHSKIPKAYHLYNGKSLVAHSIDKAKKSIYIQSLLFRGDEAGKIIGEKLIKRRTNFKKFTSIQLGIRNTFSWYKNYKIYKL